jgi:GNAT superfamily N-acetyltransferase
VGASLEVRPVRASDYDAWFPLWSGYNEFYGRIGATALDPTITAMTWRRFFDPDEPVFALVADAGGSLEGLAHFLYHRSTTRLELVCYLQDLYTAPARRGRGIGRALIGGVYAQAGRAGLQRVYWQTQASNAPGRRLYDSVARHTGFIVYSHDIPR